MATTTIAGIASGSPDFELLTAAVTAFGLDGILADPASDLTVFAPTDAAFVRLAQDLGFAGSDEAGALDYLVANVEAATLLAVLQYHVLAGAKDAVTLAGLGTFATEAGPTITLSGLVLEDQEPDRIDPVLIDTDIQATNGIVHVIDNVLLPADLPEITAPTIAGIVAASGTGPDDNPADFDLLLAAVSAAGLVPTLDSDAVDFTVFAPTDAAFVSLAGALGYGGSDENGALNYTLSALSALGGGDPIPLLTDILLYHVSDGSKQLAEVAALPSVETLLGVEIGVDAAAGALIDVEPALPDQGLVATDIQASNGIVHVIDGVLLPIAAPAEIAGPGVRFLFAEDGETLRGGLDGDVLVGTTGDDRLVGGWGGQTAFGGDGNDRIFTKSGDDVAFGGNGNDWLFMGLGDDTADGGAGRDLIQGGLGNDVITGGAGRDKLWGSSGNDIIDGGDALDWLLGGWGDDSLSGGAGNDRLRGSFGDDTLEGGAGNDHMDGGFGHDTFVFAEGFGHDRITGTLGFFTDTLDFSGHAGVSGIDDLTIEQSGLNTVISDGEGNSITLTLTLKGSVTEADFVF